MSAVPQPQPKALSPAEWEQEFIRTLKADYQAHEGPLVPKLLGDTDTLHHVADHVRHYVTDFWKTTNEDRGLYGAEMKHNLERAIAGQLNTISAFQSMVDRYQDSFDSQTATLIDPGHGLQIARGLLARLEYMRDHAAGAFNVKSMGYAGDLQTLYSLDCLVRHRLDANSYDTIATLLDCGFTVEGQDKEVTDPKNIQNRLAGFIEKHTWLAEQTDAAVRSIPRK